MSSMPVGTTGHPTPADSTPMEIDRMIESAAAAAGPLAAMRPGARAALLRAAADALDAADDELIPLAVEETSLPEGRVRGELKRSTGQLRMFADVLDEGGFLEAIIDGPDPKAVPTPCPDLRRMLQPVGPVLVFAASNFPFAFSVPGGDTASALAAGCPVVVKAHPGHPRLSDRTADVLASALVEAGAPTGVVNLVHGVEAGATALRDPRIKAAAFTGSEGGGRALFQIANQREQPIPFYGELGSLNPVFVTPGAIAVRGNQIVDGYVASFTLGIGQFCTKPGVLLVPVGHGLEDRLVSAVRQVSAGRMLTERIRAAFVKGEQRTAALPRVRTLVRSEQHDDVVTAPSLFTVTVPDLLADPDALLQECFGPTSVVVEYDGQEELLAAARAFAGNLTATVHGEATSETEFVRPLLELLRERAGRLVWNGWPTGVAVAWSMHHGGPYPATTASLHTSVGATALRRFQSPVVYQDMPADLLPEALADRNVLGIPRRVDGTLTRADLGQAR